MNLLAFDTSTETMSVALQRAPAAQETSAAQWHHTAPGGAQTSTQLIPAIEALMAAAGLAYTQLDAIVFGRGPGSFTGLRSACAVAQGLAFGAQIKVLPVDTLLAVAEQARSEHASAAEHWRVAALLDARMDQLYACRYVFNSGLWLQDGPCALFSPEDLVFGECHALAGNVFDGYGTRLVSGALPRWRALPSASALLRLAPALLAAGDALGPEQALPLYVRDQVALTTAERAAQAAQP